MNEIWKDCLGYEEFLSVSNFGKVKAKEKIIKVIRNNKHFSQCKKERYLSPCKTKTGYLEVAIVINKQRKKFLLHRLIGIAFIDGYSPELTINHIDGNKLNNSLENLEWVTLSKNSQHEWEIGLVNLRGDKHPSKKLNSGKVRIIRDLLKLGATPNSLAVLLGLNSSTIHLIKKGKRWNHLQ